MNYALSREIYDNKPWMVDKATFTTLSSMLLDFRGGVKSDDSQEKLNSLYLYDIQSDTKIITNTGQLSSDSTSDLVYVINLNGPIIKNGGMSTYGMKDLIKMMDVYQADARVKGGIFLTDSGGGSQLGMELMQHAVRNRMKPIVSLVERAGMAGSAAYGIISESDWIMAESGDSQVGSIGTMISFKAAPNKSIDANGEKTITIYASASTKKNLWFEEALNKDNYQIALDEVLDPANERFRSGVKSVRPNVTAKHLDGSVYPASEVIGTLVDEIGNFKDAVNKVIELSSSKKYISETNFLNNKNSTAMTAEELKAQHPATHQAVFNAGIAAGIAAEKDRCGSWLAHSATDLEAVKKGIEGGGEITSTARENFLVKANSKTKLKEVSADSAADLLSQESEDNINEPTEAEAFYAKVAKSAK